MEGWNVAMLKIAVISRKGELFVPAKFIVYVFTDSPPVVTKVIYSNAKDELTLLTSVSERSNSVLDSMKSIIRNVYPREGFTADTTTTNSCVQEFVRMLGYRNKNIHVVNVYC